MDRVLDEFITDDGKMQQMVLKKNPMPGKNSFQIYCYLVEFDGSLTLQGYMYFFVSQNCDSASYAGTYVHPSFRRSGIAKKMMATWIKFCLENGIEDLKTIKRQRKPFLLYMLKGYSFELKRKELYEGRSIHICEKSGSKALLFDDLSVKKIFLNSKIYQDDSYIVLDDLGDYQPLDKVILNHCYFLTDGNTAYQKSLKDMKK